MQIAEVEHPQWSLTRRQDRHLDPSQRERPDLVARGVPEAGDATQGTDPEGTQEKAGGLHPARLPQWDT